MQEYGDGDELDALLEAIENHDVPAALTLVTNSPGLCMSKGLLGLTPVHVAAEQGEILLAKKMLELGADATIKDDGGDTPLDSAALAGHFDIVTLLLPLEQQSLPPCVDSDGPAASPWPAITVAPDFAGAPIAVKVAETTTAFGKESIDWRYDVEFDSKEDESKYVEFDEVLIRRIQNVFESLHGAGACGHVHQNWDWWPNRLRFLHIDVLLFTREVVQALQAQLQGPQATWRITACVERSMPEGRSPFSADVLIYSDHITVEPDLVPWIAFDTVPYRGSSPTAASPTEPDDPAVARMAPVTRFREPSECTEKDLDAIVGTWRLVTVEHCGETMASTGDSPLTFHRDGTTTQVFTTDPTEHGRFQLHPRQGVLEHQRDRTVETAIYRVAGNRLTICWGRPIPTEFATAKGDRRLLWVLERAESEKRHRPR